MNRTNTQRKEEDPKDLAPAQGTALEVYDYGDDAGAGMEDVGKDEYLIPFFRILQALSPQCKPPAQGGVEGARPGMIINTATGELFPGEPGILFIPVHRDHNYVQYTPRDAGGGFIGIKPVDDELVLSLRGEQGNFGKLQVSDGTELTETFYLYGIAVPDDGMEQRGMVAFASSSIKKYKSFVTRVMGITYRINRGNESNPNWQQITPPLWAHRWILGTQYEKNKKGEFYNWRLTLAEEPPIKSRLRLNDPLYVQGREFYELIKGGRMRADYKQAQPDAEGGDVPF